MPGRNVVLVLVGCLVLSACSSDDGNAGDGSDAGVDSGGDAGSDSGADGGGGDSGLPTSFGDCASPPCEVALEAFTKSPGTIPYCESSKDAVDVTCPAAQSLQAGTCNGLWIARNVYAFTGDFFECLYDQSSGALVGAKWSPDNHPTQIAGEQLPAGCQLEPVCSLADAGTD